MNIRDRKRQFAEKQHYARLNIQTALFDMDGVLFDSMPMHAKAWVAALESFHIPFTEQDVYLNEGSRGSDTVQTAYHRLYDHDCDQQTVDTIYATKSRIFESLPPAKPMPGAYELLQTLQQNHIRSTVVTGSGELSTINKIEETFPGIFDPKKIVTAYNVKKGKPHPDPYLKGLEMLHVQASQAMVVENAPMGIQAAAAAGIFSIALNTGPLPDEELLNAGAQLIYHSMDELRENVLSIIGG
ncbi:MAG: HAD-IA family hydrolase [Paludibacteraceae bacterium]|nr:HAD-IA family hydrolase [Paludibacteraceae bacterium]